MKRADRKNKTIADLLLSADKLFDQNGYEATGLRDICKAAGVSTGAFFANFKGKEELYRELYCHAPISQRDARELLRIAIVTAKVKMVYPDLSKAANDIVERLVPDNEPPVEEMGEADPAADKADFDNQERSYE